MSPVTVTHVSSGHAINIDTRDFQSEVFSANNDSRGYLGPFSREEHFLHSGSDYHDQIEQISIPESGDSGLSPDNSSSYNHSSNYLILLQVNVIIPSLNTYVSVETINLTCRCK